MRLTLIPLCVAAAVAAGCVRAYRPDERYVRCYQPLVNLGIMPFKEEDLWKKCTPKDKELRLRYFRKLYGLDKETEDAILQNRVIRGMNELHVMLAWGNEGMQDVMDGNNVWIYKSIIEEGRITGGMPEFVPATYVVFSGIGTFDLTRPTRRVIEVKVWKKDTEHKPAGRPRRWFLLF